MHIYTEDRKLGLNSVFPKEWQILNETILIAFCITEILTAKKEKPNSNPEIIHQNDSLWVIVKGRIIYAPTDDITVHGDSKLNVELGNRELKSSLYLISFVKFNNLKYNRNQTLLLAKANAIIAGIQCGLNIVSKTVATSVTEFTKMQNNFNVRPDNKLNITTQAFWGADLETSDFHRIFNTSRTFNTLDKPIKNRFILSANWLLKSRNLSGPDSFLAKWISLETLCMPDRTNIMPIVDLLSNAYGYSSEIIKEKFQIGRSFGLRGDIVHNGYHVDLEFKYLSMIDFIILDCMIEILNLNCVRYTEKYLKVMKFDPTKYLKILQKK